MKNLEKKIIFGFILMMDIWCFAVAGFGKETAPMVPVYGKELKDGAYEVEVDSSSSMFRVVEAVLYVADGDMTAEITLSGNGYLKLFMGTGEEAQAAGEEAYIPYAEDEDGAYTYRIPVEALNLEFDCAAYSRRKERWYDRQLVLPSSSLPKEAFLEKIKLMEQQDGDYRMEVSLKGGTNRAKISSPARIRISEGTATARIEWSSPDYDYMMVDGIRYLPINQEGNSVFEIPVLVLDQEMEVIADTVAMSRPHEISYTLTFHSDTIQKEAGTQGRLGTVITAAFFSGALVMFWFCSKRKEKR